MNYLNVLQQIFEVCVIPLLGVLTAFLVEFIQAKKNQVISLTENELQKKYIDMLANTINSCVIATNQTYVDAMKNQNAFDKEAQQKAFEKTVTAVEAILTDDARKYLSAAYGDLDLYIKQQIEATVKLEKA